MVKVLTLSEKGLKLDLYSVGGCFGMSEEWSADFFPEAYGENRVKESAIIEEALNNRMKTMLGWW